VRLVNLDAFAVTQNALKSTQLPQRTLETKLARQQRRQCRRLCHYRVHQVVCQQMRGNLLLNHRWRLTAQDIHLHHRFDCPEIESNVPAPAINSRKFNRSLTIPTCTALDRDG